MKIVADAHIPFIKDYFSKDELILRPGRLISHNDTKNADMLLVRSITCVDEALLANSKVRFVGSVTAGKDHLDTKWLDKMKISWQVAEGFNAPPVVDYILSVIAALSQQHILKIDNQSLKAAVIGAGNIGSLVVDRLKQLGFDVRVCDPIREQHEQLNPTFLYTQMQALENLDLISLHVPLTKTGDHPTFHMIDANFLKRQKPGCILINTSRGAVIDSKALLTHGSHLHWCFDVWENEPNIDHAILKQALIATPHIAGYSTQSKRRGIDMICRAAHAKKFLSSYSEKLFNPSSFHLKEADSWQEIVLSLFNPLLLTEKMRRILLGSSESEKLFDEMRHQFQERWEFEFVEILSNHLSTQDQSRLSGFGFNIRN